MLFGGSSVCDCNHCSDRCHDEDVVKGKGMDWRLIDVFSVVVKYCEN